MWRKASVLFVVIMLMSGCSSGARTGAMTAGVAHESIVSSNDGIKNAITLGKVAGGSDTNPLWKPNVSTDNFREALRQSLQLNVLLASSVGHYRLDADLLDLDQPLGGFDIEVTAHVHYQLVDLASGRTVFDETIITPHTTDFSDALMGSERMRLANEGAIHDNIQELIKKLFASSVQSSNKPPA